ncbi:Uncharacterized protein APZ42_031677 [Daphnia magna]|uniref:Uncharacterized protein n=1 Tax=Daphnia magna TaxID=35525 RepID=A0A0P6DP98_9CRUS|nr:Uncharacterized protein APZ42_031677 [Daphnia magna]
MHIVTVRLSGISFICSLCIVAELLYSFFIPEDFDRFPLFLFLGCATLMVIPCVHLFTKLPLLLFVRFHFPCTWPSRPFFYMGYDL